MRDRCDECGGQMGAQVEDDDPPVFCSEVCYIAYVAGVKADRREL